MKKDLNLPAFTLEIKEIIFGGLLGDFNLQSFTNGKSWRLRILASDKSLVYVEHLQKVFDPWVGTKMKSIIEENKVTNNIYKKWYFNTKVALELNKFGSLYYQLIPREGKKYPKHQKILPSKDILMERLTARAVAYWLMDDGSFTGSSIKFFTNNFTQKEVNLLREVLLEKYNIKTTLQFVRKKEPIIYVRTESLQTLRLLVSDFILPSFKYKLGQYTA
jgi:hypothetical protein